MKDLFTEAELRASGFEGFMPIRELFNNRGLIPCHKGVYAVVRKTSAAPSFLEKGTGGHFKDKNPNVPVRELLDNWVEGSCVLYIGKAGDLNKRIGQYLRFGQGGKVGHWGGRYIWQLEDAQDLLVCWRQLYVEDPSEVESGMICDFKSLHSGMRPFANLKD